jgi:3-phytase
MNRTPYNLVKHSIAAAFAIAFLGGSCNGPVPVRVSTITNDTTEVQPVVVTDTVTHDTDDPAIWYNHADPAASLVIGTDKAEDGALYVFNLNGQVVRSVKGLRRPNNVDVEYGLQLEGRQIDIAVTTERLTKKIRVYSLPEMTSIDGGGIPVFVGENTPEFRDLMGIALYKSPAGKVMAIVGRKTGPKDEKYLWQYELLDDGNGRVTGKLLRKFGRYSGLKEIEAIAVDDKLGYVYCSDEGLGIRKYYADPAKGNKELALFGTSGFTGDHEGISIYETSDTTGFIIVSDQQSNRFQIFRREGDPGNSHQHSVIRTVNVAARESDGSEVISLPLGGMYPHGLFVAMSDDKTFHFYQPEQILGKTLMGK